MISFTCLQVFLKLNSNKSIEKYELIKYNKAYKVKAMFVNFKSILSKYIVKIASNRFFAMKTFF